MLRALLKAGINYRRKRLRKDMPQLYKQGNEYKNNTLDLIKGVVSFMIFAHPGLPPAWIPASF